MPSAGFHWLLIVLLACIQLVSAWHALLYKRDPKGSWAWIAICLLFPPVGPILYFLLGINRVRTKAKKLKWYWPLVDFDVSDEAEEAPGAPHPTLKSLIRAPGFHPIAEFSQALTKRPLLGENSVETLYNAEQAFPAMLQAINSARTSLYLASYIIDTKHSGLEIIEALAEACRRGVTVKVIIDAVGELYTWPLTGRVLHRYQIPFTRFIPLKIVPPSPFINLRNHRKILVVDGIYGFTGGMNLRDSSLKIPRAQAAKIQDTHFRLTGPIVNQMEQVFLEDWGFCTNETGLQPSLPRKGNGTAICRTITVGPNQDLNKLNITITGAVTLSKKRVAIMTPYFLPHREMIGALQSAALRGVQVDIILPRKNNLPFVHWATRNMLWELLQYRVNIYYQPPPFNHSKMFTVDESYAQIGSANLDPRSLRLNFEMVVEVFDTHCVQELNAHMDQVIAKSANTTLAELDARGLLVRTRDSLCWLFSPYF
ncbi:MAG: PLDc N-terminal domain-containing protein [Desulfohalobiaceae bacterium]|nr:PLDc N-terminal domain-containing protein [Desulfohalobiaceae bacterium]